MSASLRIGITCWPTFGGSGIIATEIGLELARRGHLVHFICEDLPVRLDRYLPRVFFHAVEARVYPPFEHSPYTLALASKMAEVARYESLELLHVHYAVPHATSAFLARQVLGAAAPKIVTTLHGTDITLVGSDPSFLPITRFSILASDGLTAPSEALRRATFARLDVPDSTGIELIPNFVDTEVYRRAEPRRFVELGRLFPRLPARWDDERARPRVLAHNSNFRPLKRVDDVVRVFARVRAERPAVLVLIGDGPERSRIEALCRELDLADAVAFLGRQLQFVEVLQQADLFLLPSESESFGLAALEAMACGVPVVASRTGGLPEVVPDGEAGLLFPVGDVAGMAEGALALLADEPRRRRLAEAARARVESRYRMPPAVDRYERYYRQVLGRA